MTPKESLPLTVIRYFSIEFLNLLRVRRFELILLRGDVGTVREREKSNISSVNIDRHAIP